MPRYLRAVLKRQNLDHVNGRQKPKTLKEALICTVDFLRVLANFLSGGNGRCIDHPFKLPTSTSCHCVSRFWRLEGGVQYTLIPKYRILVFLFFSQILTKPNLFGNE